MITRTINNGSYLTDPSFIIALMIPLPQMIQAMEAKPLEINIFESFLEDVQVRIIKDAAYDDCYKLGHANNLALVCKDWYHRIKDDHPSKLEFYNPPHNLEESCLIEIFLKGELIYIPENGKDVVELRIADLPNPFSGAFDLSKCEEAKQCLSISTGYRMEMKRKNTRKIEIWMIPRFLAKKEIHNSAKHLKHIFPDWKPSAPVGIFLTWGEWNDLNLYEHLTSKDLNFISNNTLYRMACSARKYGARAGSSFFANDLQKFRINFGPS